MISNLLRHARLSSRSTVVISSTVRGYISRAHPPETTPTFAIGEALNSVLGEVGDRKASRQQKWETNSVKRAAKGVKVSYTRSGHQVFSQHFFPFFVFSSSISHTFQMFASLFYSIPKEDGPYRNQDETIELALNLNLDPRKPGQAVRGALSLPNGTGKQVNVVVFTSDDGKDTIQAAKDAGATYAGGASLIESIQNGDIPVNFDRALATPDMMPQLSKIARILGPRGLMPNAKLDTIQPAAKIADAVKAQAAGMLQYRTDKNGIVHVGVGRGSFSEEKLAENIREFMTAIQAVKPESYGKGKKKSGGPGKGKSAGAKKDAKYYLKAYLTSTQGKGSVNIDIRTLDPTSTFFMGVAPA